MPKGGIGVIALIPAPLALSELLAAASSTFFDSDIGVSVVDSDMVIVATNTIIDAEIGITMQSQGSFFSDPMCFPPLVPSQNSRILSNIILDATEAGVQSTAFTGSPSNTILGLVPELNNVQDNFIMSDPTIEFAPIGVSSGQNSIFIENLIFLGPTSRIVDQGFNNTFANFCTPVPATGCNPLTTATALVVQSIGLLPPPRPASAYILPAQLPVPVELQSFTID